MKAIWNGKVIAQSDSTLEIEGNQYFPHESISKEFFSDSTVHTTCPWKGVASYYNIAVDGQTNASSAWYYPSPKEGSKEIVAESNNGKGDFSNYVAFWKGVEVVK